MTIAKRILEARNARGWSQSELARQMTEQGEPWYQTTVARTEKDERDMRVTEAIQLAEVLGVALMWLLKGKDPNANYMNGYQEGQAHVKRAIAKKLDDLASLVNS